MKRVAVLSQKGGSGKTTITLHLAVETALRGMESAIIDLDPQASAGLWRDYREASNPAVVAAQAARLPKILQVAEEQGAEIAWIDTASHTESTALAAAREADLVLIPCRPAILDIRAIQFTVDLVNLTKAKAAFVLNGVPPRGLRGNETRRVLSRFDIPVADVEIVSRMAFSDALVSGEVAQEFEPGGKAAKEMRALYQWVVDMV